MQEKQGTQISELTAYSHLVDSCLKLACDTNAESICCFMWPQNSRQWQNSFPTGLKTRALELKGSMMYLECIKMFKKLMQSFNIYEEGAERTMTEHFLDKQCLNLPLVQGECKPKLTVSHWLLRPSISPIVIKTIQARTQTRGYLDVITGTFTAILPPWRAGLRIHKHRRMAGWRDSNNQGLWWHHWHYQSTPNLINQPQNLLSGLMSLKILTFLMLKAISHLPQEFILKSMIYCSYHMKNWVLTVRESEKHLFLKKF